MEASQYTDTVKSRIADAENQVYIDKRTFLHGMERSHDALQSLSLGFTAYVQEYERVWNSSGVVTSLVFTGKAA